MVYYFSALSNDDMSLAATRMELAATVLSENSQAQKDRYHVSSLARNTEWLVSWKNEVE